jgi:hypothetical protein
MFGAPQRIPEEVNTFAISTAGTNLLGRSKHIKRFELITRQPATVIVNNKDDEPLKPVKINTNTYRYINNIPKKAEFLYGSGMTITAPNGTFGGVDSVCIKEDGIEYFIEYFCLDTRGSGLR